MTEQQAELLAKDGAKVLIDAGTDHEQLARLWIADCKWTEDMRGMARVQRINDDGSIPSWAPKRGWLLIERRRLTQA